MRSIRQKQNRLCTRGTRSQSKAWQDATEDVANKSASSRVPVQAKPNSAPIIRDFFEHVRTEEASIEDDLDDAYPFPDNLADPNVVQQGEHAIKITDELVETEWLHPMRVQTG